MIRYIDADALKSKLEGVLKDCAGTGLFSIDSLILIADTLQMIETEPTANVQEVKHGKWIPVTFSTGNVGAGEPSVFWGCSLCHCFAIHTNFCPHCGAKMDLKEE